MKNYIKFLTVLLVVLLLSSTSEGHPGRTDSSGGHSDRRTGKYHYHGGGGSSGSSGSSASQATRTTTKPEPFEVSPGGIYFVRVLKVRGDGVVVLNVRLSDTCEDDVRLIGIDISSNSKKARDFITKSVINKKIWIEYDQTMQDKNGAWLVYAWLEQPKDGTLEEAQKNMFNAILLKENYATPRKEDFVGKYDKIF